MKTSTKYILGIGIPVGIGLWLTYRWYNTAKLISKNISQKQMTIRFHGKTVTANAYLMSQNNQAQAIDGEYSLIPSYGNMSDKKTLNGLSLIDKNGTIINSFYF